MITKYGKINENTFEEYIAKLSGRIYKILPLKEEKCKTWSIYIESLIFELFGLKNIFNKLEENTIFISLIGTLEQLKNEDDIATVKREVFKCIDLLKKL